MTTVFLIPGKPQGKERPRFNADTRTTYTPPRTKEYKRTVKYSYLSAYPAGTGMHTGALKVTIYAVFTVPAKWTVEKRSLQGRM
nr:MAG TPA: Endodeoxyribonuclease RusA [Caudoviricetes sp.]